jgi:hypothetical protein
MTQQMKQLYCPKCGGLLEMTSDGLRCIAGQLPFAKELSDRLVSCYAIGERVPKDLLFGFAVGGT